MILQLTEAEATIWGTKMTILAMSALAVLPFVGKLIWTEYKKRKKELRYKNQVETLRAISNVYVAQETLEHHPAIDRVLILEVSNGGHEPKPGSKMHGRAVKLEIDSRYGDANDLMKRYEDIGLDSHYIQMVIELIEKGVVKYDVGNMPEGILKNFYKVEKVKFSDCYLVHVDIESHSTFIMSIATFNEDSTAFKSEEIEAFKATQVKLIQDNFSRYRS